MVKRNPDRFVEGNGSGPGPSGDVIVKDSDGDELQINPDGSINVSGVTVLFPPEVEIANDIGNAVPVVDDSEPVVSGKDFNGDEHPLFTSVTGKLQVESDGQNMATETTLAEIGADIDAIETNFDTQLSTRATETSLLPVTNRFSPSVGTVSPDLPYSTIGDKTLYTPASGNRVRLKWVGASSYVTQAAVPIKFKFGSGDYFWDWLLFGAFAHSDVREGDVDEPLYIHIGVNGSPVYAALDVEEF